MSRGSRARASYVGMLIADSVAMPVHWFYDQRVLRYVGSVCISKVKRNRRVGLTYSVCSLFLLRAVGAGKSMA
jgi:hypothetical protein